VYGVGLAVADAPYALESVGVNAAVSECEPRASDVVTNCAVPPDTATALPSEDPLSENCTEPTADDGVTVAVIVTVAPGAALVDGETPMVVVVVAVAIE